MFYANKDNYSAKNKPIYAINTFYVRIGCAYIATTCAILIKDTQKGHEFIINYVNLAY